MIGSRLRVALASIAVTALTAEFALRAASGLGMFRAEARGTEPNAFYQDLDRRFGVWHPPHARWHARSSCYDVVYESNSFGARDPERPLRSETPRAVVLGDSFVEGVGVALGRRFTDLLESRTGVAYLNFGTAGNFSSVQEWLLYESLASRFDHDRVLIFTLPDNDFLENDPERWWQPHRYRPYLRERGEGFELDYPLDFEQAQLRAQRQLVWNRVHDALYLYRFGAWLDTTLRVRAATGTLIGGVYVGYTAWSERDLERLTWSYRKLRDAAGGREVAIFTIPRLNDLLAQRERGYPDELARRLSEFAAAESGIRYADLMPAFTADARRRGRDYTEYFLPCDGHWSELGHEVAAEAVSRLLAEPASAAD